MQSSASRTERDLPCSSSEQNTGEQRCQLREEIDSTQSLVEAYNQDTDEAELCTMREWLKGYIDWFPKQSIETLSVEDAHEFALIGQLIPRNSADQALLHSWFCCLCNAIRDGRYGVNKIVGAMEVALFTLDKSTFKQDPSLLLDLSNDLLSTLDPTKTVFERATYDTHRATLSALHQTFVVVQQVSPSLLDPTVKGGPYQAFKARLAEIAGSQNYYPILYQVKLIGQSIQRLEKGKRIVTLSGALNRLLRGTVGALYVIEGLRGLAAVEFKFDAFEAGCKNLQEAFTSLRIDQKPWYEWIQALSAAALAASDDPEKYEEFEVCCNELKQKQHRMKKDDRRALRFGVIEQLQVLILHASNDDVQWRALSQLLDLAKKKKYGGWGEKASTLEALLDAFGAVYNSVPDKDVVISAVGSLQPLRDSALKKIFNDWLGTSSIRYRLQAFSGPQASAQGGRLFHCMKSTTGQGQELVDVHNCLKEIKASLVKEEVTPCKDWDGAQDMLKELKARYQADNFVMVESFFDGGEPKHVTSFQFDLVRYEEVKKKEDADKQEDHSVENHERSNMRRMPMQLEELFIRRSVKQNGLIQEINKVLLVGNPGTGKTTISKKLATLWASGQWGVEFDAVYVLQVRDVSDAFYDESNLRHARTLATAIVNNRFRRRDDEQFEALHEQLNKELQKKTTLLILDGLDESPGACDVILQEAKHCTCKLLMLSRPYGLHQERRIADIEVECLGLSDEQLADFVNQELSRQGSEQLLSFLKANRSIWDVAHIPVTTNILCFLWKEGNEDLLKEGSNGSLLVLYSKMTYYIWARYVKKYKIEDADRNEAFAVIGRIAFEALKEGQILISQTLVKKHATNTKLDKMLEMSGFLLLRLEGILYHFPHLTHEEYFAGKSLATDLLEGSDLVKRNARNFIAENKYCPKYRVMLSFAAEEIRRTRGIEAFDMLMSIVDQGPISVMSMHHIWLKLRFLESFLLVPLESKDVDSLHRTSAPKVARTVAKAVHMCMRDKKTRSVAFDALEAAPNSVGIFSVIVSASMHHHFRLPAREAVRNTPRMARILKSALKQLSSPIKSTACSSRKGSAKVREKALGPLLDSIREVCWNSAFNFGKNSSSHQTRATWMKNLVDSFLAMSNDADWDVRQPFAKTVPQLIGLVPDRTEELVDKFLVMGSDTDGFVRCAFAETVPQVIGLVPDRTEELVDKFLTISNDAEPYARRKFTGTVPQVIEVAPGRTEELVDKFLAMSHDVHGLARITFAETVLQVIGVVPGRTKDLLNKFLLMSHDINENIREAFAVTVPQLIRLVPGRTEDLVDKFLVMSDGVHGDAREGFAREVPQLIGLVPGRTEDLVDKFLAMCINADGFAQRGCARAVPQVIGLGPGRAEDLVDKFLELRHDTGGRSFAESVPQVIQLVPGRTGDLVDKFLAMSNDPRGAVRENFVKTVPQVVKVVPDRGEELVDKFLAMSNDTDGSVRESFAQTVPQLIGVVPGRTEDLVDKFLAMRDSSNRHVRESARHALEEIPLDMLINCSQFHGDHLVPCILPKVLNSEVVAVEDRAPKSTRLCLTTPASRSVEWVRPRKQVRQLIRSVRNQS